VIQADRSSARAACAVLLAVAVSGCSFVFVEGPPARYLEMDSFTCTEGNAVPIVDALWGGGSALGAINAWIEPTTRDRTEIMLLGSGMALVATGSAVVGFRRRAACRAARLEVARTRQRRSPAFEPVPSEWSRDGWAWRPDVASPESSGLPASRGIAPLHDVQVERGGAEGTHQRDPHR